MICAGSHTGKYKIVSGVYVNTDIITGCYFIKPLFLLCSTQIFHRIVMLNVWALSILPFYKTLKPSPQITEETLDIKEIIFNV